MASMRAQVCFSQVLMQEPLLTLVIKSDIMVNCIHTIQTTDIL
jgi:hypothetical protein